MNKTQRDAKYPVLARRDGERCFVCKDPGNRKTLVIDHWDNNNSNNAWDNLHLLCRGCNTAKNHWRKNGKGKLQSTCVYVSVCERNGENESISAELEKNQQSEGTFRRWLFSEMLNVSQVDYEDVIDSGAEFAACSQETIKRYVRKMTSKKGLFELERDGIVGKKVLKWRSVWQAAQSKRRLIEQAENWKSE